MSMQLEWNDKGLKELFDSLSDPVQAKFHANALRSTARKLEKIVKRDAASAGLSRTGPAEKNGWKWARYGRIVNSVDVGKLWKKGTTSSIRVFNRGGRTLPFMRSAPHAHLIILGHKKFLPRRDGTTYSAGRTQGEPIYQTAYSQAESIFEKELEASVARMVRRLNKSGKL